MWCPSGFSMVYVGLSVCVLMVKNKKGTWCNGVAH